MELSSPEVILMQSRRIRENVISLSNSPFAERDVIAVDEVGIFSLTKPISLDGMLITFVVSVAKKAIVILNA